MAALFAACRPSEPPLRFSAYLSPERHRLPRSAAPLDTASGIGAGVDGIPSRAGVAPGPDFSQAGRYADGRAPVLIGSKWGYADSAGNLAIPADFDWAGNFHEGRAAVSVAGVHRFIDTAGDSVGRLVFSDARRFSEGLAAVRFGDAEEGAWGFIDRDGRLAIPPLFAEVPGGFSEGLAVVGVGHESARRYGYIDTSGGFALDSLFDAAGDFSEGLAAVGRGAPALRWSYVDRMAARAFPGEWSWAGRFREGRALVRLSDGSFARIDRLGRASDPLPASAVPGARRQGGQVTYELPNPPVAREASGSDPGADAGN